MKNNRITESIQKIMPDEASKDFLLNNAFERAKTDRYTITKGSFAKKMKTTLIAAIIAVIILTAGGFAYESQIIPLLGGGRIESGRTADGGHYVSISSHELSPAEVRDGRVYFMLDGSGTEITSYCTETTFYMYERVAENGYRHIFIVGGTPDSLGWCEFIWDEEGNMTGSTAQYRDDANGEQPKWLNLAYETLWD